MSGMSAGRACRELQDKSHRFIEQLVIGHDAIYDTVLFHHPRWNLFRRERPIDCLGSAGAFCNTT